MGDLANMTSVHGEVDGFRLLRWLRSRAAMAGVEFGESSRRGNRYRCGWHAGREDLLTEMADDLERELTPPDYPEDDGNERSAFMSGPHDPHKRSPGADDDGVDLDDKDTGPCEVCGQLADRMPARRDGRVLLCCRGCAAPGYGEGVNLDDSAPKGGPE